MKTGCLNEVRPRRPEQYTGGVSEAHRDHVVSMKSGLEGRNNLHDGERDCVLEYVSMKSGLEGRNNRSGWPGGVAPKHVSMKSGLEGRNNRGPSI